MKKVMIITLVIFTSNINLYSKIYKLKSLKVNKCIKVSMVKESIKKEVNWFVYAENKCFEPMVIGKKLKINIAKNITADEGSVLDIRNFIVPKKSKNSKYSKKKLILNVTKKTPNQKSIFKWSLI